MAIVSKAGLHRRRNMIGSWHRIYYAALPVARQLLQKR